MASPTMTPPPVAPPPAPVTPRRSFAGPIVLITIGVVFLLANMGVLSAANVFLWFARYWPALLILWGIIKLYEYWDAQRQGYRPRGIGVGGVFLIIFVVLLGGAATGMLKLAPHVRDEMGWQFGDDDTWTPIFGKKFTYSRTLEAPLPANGSVRIVNERGNVKVTTSADDKVRVIVNQMVVADSDAEAQRVSDAWTPRINVESTTVVVDAARPVGASGSARNHLEVQVPRKARVDILAQRGDLEVHGRDGDVKAQTSRGDVLLEDINGFADINLRHGDITARKVAGDVKIDGRVDDANVEDVGGSVELRGDYFGGIHVRRIGKGMRFVSSRTDLQIARLEGDLTMESDVLRVTSLAGPASLRSRSKDVHFENVSGDLTIEDSNAEIEVHITKAPLGNVTINNRKGRIDLVVPANAGFAVDASVAYGDIRSDFPELKVETQRHDSRATGRVGTGGGNIRLSTEHGDIAIRRAP